MDLKDLKIMNNVKLDYLKQNGLTGKRNEIINEILEDEACFFKLEEENAMIVLKEIGIEQDCLKNVYKELISSDNYYKLISEKKINPDDEEVIIKYKLYSSDVFNKRSN